MMFCPKCGKKQIDNAKYCYSCGSIIILPIQDDDSLPDHKNTNLEKSNESLIEVTKNSFDYNGDKEINIDSLFDVEDLSISELVTCPICGKRKVARSAVSCPECGYGISEHFEKVKREQEERQSIKIPKKPSYPIGSILLGIVFLLWSAANVIVITTSEDSSINGVGVFFAMVFFVIAIACFYSGNKIYQEKKDDYVFATEDIEGYRTWVLKEKREREKDAMVCPQCKHKTGKPISSFAKNESYSIWGPSSKYFGKNYECSNCKYIW